MKSRHITLLVAVMSAFIANADAQSAFDVLPAEPEDTSVPFDTGWELTEQHRVVTAGAQKGAMGIFYMAPIDPSSREIFLLQCESGAMKNVCQIQARFSGHELSIDAVSFLRDTVSPKVWVATPRAVFMCDFYRRSHPGAPANGCRKMADLPNPGGAGKVIVSAARWRLDRGIGSRAYVGWTNAEGNLSRIFQCDDFNLNGCIQLSEFADAITAVEAPESPKQKVDGWIVAGWRVYRCTSKATPKQRCQTVELVPNAPTSVHSE